MLRILLAALLIGGSSSAAAAQLLRCAPANDPPVAAPPRGLTPQQEEIWPYPEPEPHSWWQDKRPAPPEAADPLGGRHLPRGKRLPAVDNGVDPSTYRLWGLVPLQWEVLRDGEMVLEVWVRPASSVRQTIARVIVRDDGKAFIQIRAGLACCEPGIGRRVGFDAELPAGAAQQLQALQRTPVWSSPRLVRVEESGRVEAVCVNAMFYDLTLVTPEQTHSLHRECDDAAIGQVADVLEPVLRAALGHEPRIDVLFPRGVDFSAERAAYQNLIAGGGALRPSREARTPPPGAEPAPREGGLEH